MRTSFLLASALLLLAWAAAEEASLAALSDRLRVLADSLKANKAVSAKQQKELEGIYEGLVSLSELPQSCWAGAPEVIKSDSTEPVVVTGPEGSPTTSNPPYNEPGCATTAPPAGRRYLRVKNNCTLPVWPGVYPPNVAVPPDNSWKWSPGDCKTLELPSTLDSFRLWGRTGCDAAYKCITGWCPADASGGCTVTGEPPASVVEATLRDHCRESEAETGSPDFYDQSLVDGYNLPLAVHISDGYNVAGIADEHSCKPATIRAMDFSTCPFELRLYGDQLPNTNVPTTSIAGHTVETSPCFTDPTNATCAGMVVSCRAICKALDQGWIAYYIDNVKGPQDTVNPVVTRPYGESIRWADQFLPQGSTKCGNSFCRDNPAWGAFRGNQYAKGGKMRELVCCDGGFVTSPYLPNSQFPVGTMCPTLGAGDPTSEFHDQMASDLIWPQQNETVRMSSSFPDWPLSSKGGNYAKLFKESSQDAYSWQYDDTKSLFECCAKRGAVPPTYIVTFCP